MTSSDDRSHIEYREDGSAAAFIGPDAVSVYAAASGAICGKTYKRSQMLQAAADVEVWLQTMKAALPAVQR